ncbi:MAG: Smr/MutS family protein [Desulfatibacillaceae bacterium]
MDDEPVRIPIDGTLDLHTFSPREVPGLLRDYIEECAAAGIHEVRIVCGKGTGAMRKTVFANLAKNPRVAEAHEAPPQAGGWGAVIARLKKDGK